MLDAACLVAQMDHWRLNEDDASFEDDRLERLRQQEAEATRLHAESAQFYQLARASQERAAKATADPAPARDAVADKRKKQEAPRLPAFKVQKKGSAAGGDETKASAAAPAGAVADADAPTSGGLPGMDAYGDDSDDGE